MKLVSTNRFESLSPANIALVVRVCVYQRAALSSALSDNCVRKERDKLLLSVGKTKLLEKNVTSHARDCFQSESDKHFRSKVTAQEVLVFSWGCYSADSQGQATRMWAIRPSSHPTDMLTDYSKWHRSIVPRFSPAFVALFKCFKFNIFLVIYCFLRPECQWGKYLMDIGVWGIVRQQKLGLMPPKQFGEIYLIDILCSLKL